MTLLEKLKAIDDECNHLCVGGDSCAICEAIERIEQLESAITAYRDSGITRNQLALFDILLTTPAH